MDGGGKLAQEGGWQGIALGVEELDRPHPIGDAGGDAAIGDVGRGGGVRSLCHA
jgi:hypothetical protein